MILDGKLVAENLDNYVLEKIQKNKDFYEWKYVAFLLFADNEASRVYIKMKQNKARKFWINTKVIEKVDANFEEALDIINELNNDSDCIWILIQLPLNENLKLFQWKLLGSVLPNKDIDWLWGVLFWLHQIEAINFLPATVRAIFEILYFYKIWVAWKTISVFWQSNLVWKPAVCELLRQQATVFSFNEFSDVELTKQLSKKSDIIISATWHLHLINSEYVNPDKMQVLIDVWWWKLNWKPTGDFDFDDIFSKSSEEDFMYTPVPGWVWPVTVSSIFANLVDLQDIK